MGSVALGSHIILKLPSDSHVQPLMKALAHTMEEVMERWGNEEDPHHSPSLQSSSTS